ncbi:hypothetical protein [Frankia sp. QA3]|uniref:hypothetical protein n=1 Tax=Frankia sp. QA3 TaxID=710111 RepID=UPI001E605F4C|nr:hypothetical protein [Frankia sp. QA3]
MAPHGCIEWPFRPAGVPARLDGPQEIRAYFAAAASAPVRWETFDDMVIHETADPEVVIVEYNARGRITTTGAATPAGAGVMPCARRWRSSWPTWSTVDR